MRLAPLLTPADDQHQFPPLLPVTRSRPPRAALAASRSSRTCGGCFAAQFVGEPERMKTKYVNRCRPLDGEETDISREFLKRPGNGSFSFEPLPPGLQHLLEIHDERLLEAAPVRPGRVVETGA